MRARALAALFALLGAASSAPFGCAGTADCERNSDCLDAYCSDGECKKDCVNAELDCPKGYICNAIAQCEFGGGSGGSGPGATSNATSGEGGAVSTSAGPGGGATTTTTSTTSTTGSGGGTKTELDLCGSDGECASPLVCRAMTVGGSSRCTRLCATSADCMSGTRCESIGGQNICAGDDTGRQCSSPSSCNFGCLLVGPGYCTVSCASGSDCPNGYACSPVGSPPQSVCVKLEADCSPQDPSQCIGPSACDTSINLVVGSCTTACSTAAECPRRAAGLPAWTCDGLCRRPSDVAGPLAGGLAAEYACNIQSAVVNVCNDGQHIDFNAFSIPSPPSVNCQATVTTPGFPGDSCVNSCRYQGGCSYGYSCVAVGGVGASRIGLCLPTGAGEVGASCAYDAQCAFGYCSSGACSRDCTQDGVCPTGSSCVSVAGPTVEGVTFRRCQ